MVVALPPPPASFAETSSVSSFVSPTPKTVERTGCGYSQAKCRKFGEILKEVVVAKKKPKYLRERSNSFDVREDCHLEDYYGLLGLGNTTVYSTKEHIKRNFKLVSMIFHPDKCVGQDPKTVEARFKAISMANSTLGDDFKRLMYDSKLPFDDSIPSSKAKGDFFQLYGPAFEKYAIYFHDKKATVPQLGNADTAHEDVNAFYNFWFDFKSWRDFTYLGEHRVEEAKDRDEKRWMIKQNKTVANKHKKEETRKINRLVNQAYDNDPRVKAIAEAEKAAKKAAKLAKKNKGNNEAQKKKEAEAAAAAKKAEEEAAAAKAAEAAKADAKQAKFEKDQRKKQGKRLTKFNTESGAGWSDDDIALVREKAPVQELIALVKAVKTDGPAAFEAVLAKLK